MIGTRRASERGRTEIGWLKSWHSFSFGDYYDPDHVSFGSLRVINEDIVRPASGFDTHGHRDMEIITYILSGALEHRDSLGNGSVIGPGDIQRMSAGTGVRHSEFNPSADEPVHLLQIWIIPERNGLAPGYEEKNFSVAERQGRLRLVASKTGRDGSVSLNQDADLYAALLGDGGAAAHRFQAGRKGWLQVAKGAITANGERLGQGDALSLAGETALDIVSHSAESELLLFDMA